MNATPLLDMSPLRLRCPGPLHETNNAEALDWLAALVSYEFVLGRPMEP